MGNILIIAGFAGLAVTAIAIPAAMVVLRRQLKKINEQIRREYEQ